MSDWVWWTFFAGGVLSWVGAAAIKPRGRLPGRPCRYCGYDLTGIRINDVCPECGNLHSVRQVQSLDSRIGEAWFWIAIGSVGVGSLVASMTGGVLVSLLVALVALSAACLPTLFLSSGTRRPCGTLLCLGALLPSTVLVLWMCYSAFVRHWDAQSGIVVIFLPPFACAAGGYGVLGTAILCRRLDIG